MKNICIDRQTDRQADRQTDIRLEIPVSFPEWVNKCDCGRTLDINGSEADGLHLLTCKNGGGPAWTHDSMMSVYGLSA